MRFTTGDLDAAKPSISRLTDRYEAWYRARHPQVEVVDVSDLDLLLTWKVTDGDGRFDAWTAEQLEEFLLAWCPRRVAISADDAPEMVEGVARAFTFLSDERLLSALSVTGDHLAAHARALAGELADALGDSTSFGMAKSIFEGLGLDDDEPLTPDRLDALVAQFNALPLDVRTALTDHALGIDEDEYDDEDDVPAVGPVLLPDDDAVRSSASAAPVLAGFATLAEYFRAPGRPLTAKGNIKLADAQAISELLGTETLTQTFDDGFTFRRHSAAAMPKLDHWQWWAREVGALRVRNGRLVGVEAWLKRRAKDPAGEARKSLDVLLDHGPVGSFVLHSHADIYRLVDLMTAPFLALLLTAAEPVPFPAFVDALEAARDNMGVRGAYGSPEDERHESARVVDLLLTLLERAGVVVQEDVTHEPGRFAKRRTGGTVAVTPFGVVSAVDVVRDAGLEVVTVGDPAEVSAADLADLAAREAIAPEAWMALLSDWLGHATDRVGALVALLDELHTSGALFQVMVLKVPEPLEGELAAAMHQVRETHRPNDVRGAVATMWLVEHGRLDPATLPRADLMMSSLTTLALLATHDPEGVPAAMGADRSRREHLDVVTEAARRTPPHVEDLLDAIARHHVDVVVAKAARKELMRVRSRAARQRRGPA